MQFFTGYIVCIFCAVVHILYNFAQVSYFVHFAQEYTLYSFVQVSYVVNFAQVDTFNFFSRIMPERHSSNRN